MPAVAITQAASLRRYTFTLPSTETSSSASTEGALYSIHSDHLGTPQVITNNQQQVVWQAQYQAFGEAKLTTASITNPLRFPGQYYDEESGLHYNWHRYYNPQTGRYITSDPIGLAGGVNTYGYAYQNPIVYYDPDAKIPLPVITGIIGSIAGGFGNTIVQIISNDGFNCFNWGNVVVAAGTGFVAGAAAPFVATNYIGAMALGGMANIAQYGATQAINGDEVTHSGIILNAVTGVAGGAIAGSITKNSLSFNTASRFFPSGHAKQLNNQSAIANNTGNSNLFRSLFAGVGSNTDPSAAIGGLYE